MAIRLVHVGVGVRGRHWLNIVAQHPDFVSVACVDPNGSALEEARRLPGQQHGHFVERFSDAITRAKPDAALVASPTFAHAEHVAEALNAGLPVLVEKPLAGSVSDALRIVQHARAAGRPVMVAENYRFYQAERTVRHLLASGMAGRPRWVDCVDRRDQPSHTQGAWVSEMAHPFLTEIAVHHFDSFRFLFGQRPKAIFAQSFNAPGSSYSHESAASATIEMEEGLPIQYGGTMTAAKYEFALWVEAEQGDLWTDRKRVWWRRRGARFFRPCRLVPVPKGDELPYPNAGTVSLLNEFRDCVRLGRVPETSAEDNLWTIAMVEASIVSHRDGRKVSLAEVLTADMLRQAGGSS
jgi:predicted dehydrogenase